MFPKKIIEATPVLLLYITHLTVFTYINTKFVQTLYKHYTNIIQTLYKSYTKVIQKLYKSYTNIIQTLKSVQGLYNGCTPKKKKKKNKRKREKKEAKKREEKKIKEKKEKLSVFKKIRITS